MSKQALPPGVGLGKHHWLPLGPMDFDRESAECIDAWITPHWHSFWRALETECVAGCCGIEAFWFAAEDVQRASTICRNGELQCSLRDLRMHVQQSAVDQGFVSKELNQYFSRDFLLKLLDHLVYYTSRSTTE
jgi:hypothetical protein